MRIFRLLGRNYLQRALARNHLQVGLEVVFVRLLVIVLIVVAVAVNVFVLKNGPTLMSSTRIHVCTMPHSQIVRGAVVKL